MATCRNTKVLPTTSRTPQRFRIATGRCMLARMLLHDWLARARSLGASDLHLEGETTAVVRVRGELDPLGAEVWSQFLQRGSADLALSLGALRCRASFYRTLRGVGIAVRLLTPS